jgi:hypothetical protein
MLKLHLDVLMYAYGEADRVDCRSRLIGRGGEYLGTKVCRLMQEVTGE